MNIFASLLTQCGFTDENAAKFLDVRLDTIKKWKTEKRLVPPKVYKQLKDVIFSYERISNEAAAEIIGGGFGKEHWFKKYWITDPQIFRRICAKLPVDQLPKLNLAVNALENSKPH